MWLWFEALVRMPLKAADIWSRAFESFATLTTKPSTPPIREKAARSRMSTCSGLPRVGSCGAVV